MYCNNIVELCILSYFEVALIFTFCSSTRIPYATLGGYHTRLSRKYISVYVSACNYGIVCRVLVKCGPRETPFLFANPHLFGFGEKKKGSKFL